MFPRSITLITLGVADLDRSRDFYAALGWSAARAEEGVVFIQLAGQVLALFPLPELAKDQQRARGDLGTGAMTLARNFATREEVDAAFALALKAGARPLKRPEPVFWGGYSGYFTDPDGHVWELAHNPFWPLSPDGTLTLPSLEKSTS
jgi:predicted lactoylglutathione lyase